MSACITGSGLEWGGVRANKAWDPLTTEGQLYPQCGLSVVGGQGGAGARGAVSRLDVGCQVSLPALGPLGGDWDGPGRSGA